MIIFQSHLKTCHCQRQMAVCASVLLLLLHSGVALVNTHSHWIPPPLGLELHRKRSLSRRGSKFFAKHVWRQFLVSDRMFVLFFSNIRLFFSYELKQVGIIFFLSFISRKEKKPVVSSCEHHFSVVVIPEQKDFYFHTDVTKCNSSVG